MKEFPSWRRIWDSRVSLTIWRQEQPTSPCSVRISIWRWQRVLHACLADAGDDSKNGIKTDLAVIWGTESIYQDAEVLQLYQSSITSALDLRILWSLWRWWWQRCSTRRCRRVVVLRLVFNYLRRLVLLTPPVGSPRNPITQPGASQQTPDSQGVYSSGSEYDESCKSQWLLSGVLR